MMTVAPNQGGPTPRHQNVVFPYPKMEPRKGLRPMVGRHRVPCVGQGSSRNGLAGQGPVVDICAEETGAFQCNVLLGDTILSAVFGPFWS